MSDLGRDLERHLDRAAGRRDPGTHPEIERLEAYLAGSLDEPERGALQEHLAWCRECAGLVVDLEAFPDLEAGDAPRVAKEEVAAAWQATRQRLGLGRAASVLPFRARVREAARRPGPAWALAATFLIGAIGLSLWSAHLQRRVGELSRPRVNVALHDLYPADVERDGAAAVDGPVLSAGATITLIVHTGEAPRAAGHRAEIVDAAQRIVWRADGLMLDDMGTFTIALPRAFLAPGSYRLRLLSAGAETVERVEEYPFRVESAR